MMKKLLLLILSLNLCLFARPVETFYGTIEVDEPVLLELIDSAPMQRLKHIHQYGASFYTTHKEPYTRWDHSLGVFAILRLNKAPLKEQIAGLLHDASHTIFSHVGDYLHKAPTHKDCYQDSIHVWFLEKYGIGKILQKHGYAVAQIDPHSGEFKALEQDLPNLCADRIDYNLQGAFHQGFLTKHEIKELLKDLHFDGKNWISSKPHLMQKLVRFSLHMTRTCWGSPENYVMSSWLAKALIRGLALGHIEKEDINYGKDDDVWNKLVKLRDPVIKKLFRKITSPEKYFILVQSDKADIQARSKFRGIDPWMKRGNHIVRITSFDAELAKEYQKTKNEMKAGWSIKLK